MASNYQRSTFMRFSTHAWLVCALLLGQVLEAQSSDCSPFVPISFSHAKLTANNLGGMGPNIDDEKILRYQNVATLEEYGNIDLVVQNLTTYEPFKAAENGLSGVLGKVNMKQGTSVDLRYHLVYSDSIVQTFDRNYGDGGMRNIHISRPVPYHQLRVPSASNPASYTSAGFYFSILDIDQARTEPTLNHEILSVKGMHTHA